MFYNNIMKTDLLLLQNSYFGSSLSPDRERKDAAQKREPDSIHGHVYKKENKDINIQRPTESISFSGSAVSGGDKKETSEKSLLKKALPFVFGAVALTAGALLIAGGKKEAIAKQAGKANSNWAAKLASSEKFNAILDFAERNESKVAAVMSLGLAGILKPIVVLAMPGAKREDKEVTATKNALSAGIGYGLSCAILDPISSGVNKFIKNPEKYLPKNNKLVKELAKNKAEDFVILTKEEMKKLPYKSNTLNAFKSTYKKGLGLIVAPLKAALTIAIMPYVLKVLFGDKAKKHDENKIPLYLEPLNNPAYAQRNIFQNAFVQQPQRQNYAIPTLNAVPQTSLNKVPEANTQTQSKKSNLSFKGKKESFYVRFLNQTFGLDELIARGTAWLSQTKFSEGLVGMTQKFKNPTARWSDFESFAITYFYARNTAKSKKIDKERKLPSIIQNVAVTLVSSSMAALIDAGFDPMIEKITKEYQKLSPETIKKLGGKSAKDFYDAARVLKSNTIFTAVVRFIVPVMMVPVVGSIVKKINEKAGKGEVSSKKAKAPVPVMKNGMQMMLEKTSSNVNPSKASAAPALTKLSDINQANQRASVLPDAGYSNSNKFQKVF